MPQYEIHTLDSLKQQIDTLREKKDVCIKDLAGITLEIERALRDFNAKAKEVTGFSVDDALESIFGAPADQVKVSSLDHLCTTLTQERVIALLELGGAPWKRINEDVKRLKAHLATTKNAGEDPRMKVEKGKE